MYGRVAPHPVSCAAALAVLKVIEDDDLKKNSAVVGAYFRERLEELKDKYPVIGDVRGMGLMLGVELVRDRGTKEPSKAAALDVLEAAREHGLLIGKGGLDGNILRIKPPMCITAADVEFALDVLDRAFAYQQTTNGVQ